MEDSFNLKKPLKFFAEHFVNFYLGTYHIFPFLAGITLEKVIGQKTVFDEIIRLISGLRDREDLKNPKGAINFLIDNVDTLEEAFLEIVNSEGEEAKRIFGNDYARGYNRENFRNDLERSANFFRLLRDQKDSLIISPNSIIFFEDNKRKAIVQNTTNLQIGDSPDDRWFFTKLISVFRPGIYNTIKGNIKIFFENGDIYEGQWQNGKIHNHGILTFPGGTKYDGDWLDGKFHGHGIRIFPGGTKYDGDWQNGKRHGYGVETFLDGTKYEGQWQNDEIHGYGVETLPNGTKYEGNWLDGEYHGTGTYTLPDGAKYEGQWHNGGCHGHGVEIFPDGTKYDGEWRNGKFHGHGILILPDSTKYEGQWHNGERHGHGILILPNGTKYDGEWQNDKFINDKPKNLVAMATTSRCIEPKSQQSNI